MRFLKTPFGFFCFWLCLFIVGILFPITSIFWSYLIGFLDEFLLVFFYTLLIYKEAFTVSFKRYVLGLIIGVSSIQVAWISLTDKNNIQFFSRLLNETSTIIFIVVIIICLQFILLMLGIFWLLAYCALTWGNMLAFKFLSKIRKKLEQPKTAQPHLK
jgi:hypothetical protein